MASDTGVRWIEYVVKVQYLHRKVRELPLAAKILDVGVGAEPRVVTQVPAIMIRIFVDHNLIAGPVPVRDDVVIVRGDVPIVIAEPEALPIAPRQDEYMLRAETAAEVSMRPRLRELLMRIPGATIMAYPSVVLGVDMRDSRMALLIHGNVVLGCSPLRLTARRRRNSGGSRTARRDVTAAHRCVAAAALGKGAHPKQNR
jgi:hypothetical protein